jgi:anti-sigma factor RsiW
MSEDRTQIDCKWVNDRIDEYVDGLLDSSESVRIADHCSNCAACQSEVELARLIRDGFNSMSVLECPDSVTERVLEVASRSLDRNPKIEPGLQRMTLVRSRWKPIAAAVAAAAVILVILSSPMETSPSASQAEIDQALLEAKYALAVISEAGRRTGVQVGSDMNKTVLRPVREILQETITQEL